MIIKGQARGRARQLAAHLLRADQNEIVNVIECRGTIAQDLTNVLIELEAHAFAVACKRPLYHASISPEAHRPLKRDQVHIAVDLLEQKLGLTAQPRLVVLHRSAGREHIHVVWSRIDLERGRAISDSWSYRRHEEAARELEAMFGHKPVQGAHVRRHRRPPFTRTLKDYELRQAERSGNSPAQVGATLRGLWRDAGNGRELRAKLSEAGYTLARGDRRVFVVVDPAGEVHSLSRRLGESGERVRARLDDLELNELPSVADVRRTVRIRQRQSRLRSCFAVAARQVAPRPISRRTVCTTGHGATCSAADADNKPTLAARSAGYRSARAILFASFTSRTDEAIRYAPRAQVAAIIAALRRERQAALEALNRDHAGGKTHRRSGRRVWSRKRKRSRYALRWRPPATMKLPCRTIPT